MCGMTSGLIFGVVENLIYLNVYIPDPEPGIVAWRWSICTLLHTGCSVIASIGVVQIWRHFQIHSRMPRLTDGSAWIVAAIVIHGIYNASAVMLSAVNFSF